MDIVEQEIGVELLEDQALWFEGENFSTWPDSRAHHDSVVAKVCATIKDMIAWLDQLDDFPEVRFPRLALENLPGDEIVFKEEKCAVLIFNMALVHEEMGGVSLS